MADIPRDECATAAPAEYEELPSGERVPAPCPDPASGGEAARRHAGRVLQHNRCTTFDTGQA